MAFCVAHGGCGVRWPGAELVVFQHDTEGEYATYQTVLRSRKYPHYGYSVNCNHRVPERAMLAARRLLFTLRFRDYEGMLEDVNK